LAEASAPSSSANLGPGYDTLALALDLRCRVVAEPAAAWSIAHHGPEVYEGLHGEDSILFAARRMSSEPLALQVWNQIPLCRGLGSSAAALAAGFMAAGRAAGGDPTQDDIFELVAEIEGHPDNAAATAYGGLVGFSEGRVLQLEMSESWRVVAGVPGDHLPTSDARKVVPDRVDMAVVSRSLGRVIALVDGLRTGDAATLGAAGGDELHEQPRAALNPLADKMSAAAISAGAAHACWSGAGPSVLAFADAGHVVAVREAMASVLGGDGVALTLEPDRIGVV
jgi:homoserine kinase